MSKRIGVHLRVTGHTSQGGRKYMEDCFSVAYQHTDDQSDLEYAYFGIFDGHGGSEAASYAKNHLMDNIVSEKGFWSEDDENVLHAIREGFIKTHKNMWMIQDEWPKTASGLPSTAGTTASIAFVRHGKIYTGHVGDSGIILGYQNESDTPWLAMALTEDHKPESAAEKARIENNGGKVVIKSGVPRVVWNKPRITDGHKGPLRRNTPVDEIPFLAVARSLGDLWSFNPENNVFVVSPEPDVAVKRIDVDRFRCLLFGTDGLWNMLTPQHAVTIVEKAEQNNKAIINTDENKTGWINPSKRLVEEALLRWSNTRMRADNTTVVALMLDPPGVPKRHIVRKIIKPQSQNTTSHISESYNNPCTHNSENLPIIDTPLLPLNDVQETLKASGIEENMDTEESSINSLDESSDLANMSTPFDSVSDMDESKDCSDRVYTNLENINLNEVKCPDDEDQSEDYNSYSMDFNKEYITNVIFGPLPDNIICPKPTIANINECDTMRSVDNEMVAVKIKDHVSSNSEPVGSSLMAVSRVSEGKATEDIPSFEEPNSISEETVFKSDDKLLESSKRENPDNNVDDHASNDIKSESIQIHEISSSSCTAQDITNKQKYMGNKGSKVPKPKSVSSENFSVEISKKKRPKSPAAFRRKSSRKTNVGSDNQKHVISIKDVIPSDEKRVYDKHSYIAKYNLMDVDLFPVVVLEDCLLSEEASAFLNKKFTKKDKFDKNLKSKTTRMSLKPCKHVGKKFNLKKSVISDMIAKHSTESSSICVGFKRNTRSKAKISQ